MKKSIVPRWAKGTFIWRVVLGDTSDALKDAAAKIEAVANRLDRAVDHIVIVTNAIGSDEGRIPWDGIWPYWNRLSFRIGGGWKELSQFMLDMRDKHRAYITFHVNCTDVNPGLKLYPETRAFFEQLKKAKAIYARPKGVMNQPWFGLPFIPQDAPEGMDTSDIFALVNYKCFWDSGLAKKQIDGLFSKLPFIPPLLYVDVLGPRGWCIHPGYPDGGLGGSLATQMEGIRNIVAYIKDCGCEVAGESPDRLWEHPSPPMIRYSWSHGGLSRNDYGQIGSGYGMGAMEKRGVKSMQVYGNQGGYHVQCGEKITDIILNGWDPMAEGGRSRGKNSDPLRSPEREGIREWDQVDGLVRAFYLTVAPELYHIGCEAQRLPGGATWERLDAAEGRVRVDGLTIKRCGGLRASVGGEGATAPFYPAAEATLLGSARLQDDPAFSVSGKAVGDLDVALGNGVEFTVDVPENGTYDVFIRYASVGGGVLQISMDGAKGRRIAFEDTGDWSHYGDYRVPVRWKPGRHTVRLAHHRIFAEWSDGAKAEWTLEGGFRATHGKVCLGIGGDRFCPVTWRRGRKILMYSKEGGGRVWTLPPTWKGVKKVRLTPLTDAGRDTAATRLIPVKNGTCRITLGADQSVVLEV